MKRRNKKISKNCLTCKKEFHPFYSAIGENKGLFCSRKCSKLGKYNPNWIGGKIKSDTGYVLLYKPNHPNKMTNNKVKEHRLVMEKYLGRTLEKYEIVHHRNGNKSDNRIINLELMTKSEHSRIHVIQTRLKWISMGFSGRLGFKKYI